MKASSFFLIILVYALMPCYAQDLLLFYDASERLENNDIGGPFCRAIADINGDYRDDIIRLNGNNILYLDVSSDNGTKFHNLKLDNIGGDAWTIGIGDIDNNGINDVMTSGVFNGLSIWNALDRRLSFDKKNSESNDFFAQGSNLTDINNDGWLDVFVCNDVGPNKIFLNDGTGQLIDSSSQYNLATAQPSDNSGNYASEWADVDGDGDLDLYIAKCRSGVEDFEDPRRINMLFINDNGTLVESAQDYGLAVGAQSWTANFGDIDNDGDMDLFMTNHDFRSQVFENIENDTFVEIDYLPANFEINKNPYQSALYDFNNDGWLDILIAGDEDYLLVNKGDKTFSVIDNPFGLPGISSFAIGDINHDGFPDALVSYNPLGSDFRQKDKIFLNLGNENHYFDVFLQGVMSNKSGIGARIELYGSQGKQVRQLQSGTGYGITNSLRAHFGLDDASSIDSLVILWPSGHRDVHTHPEADMTYVAIENGCLEALPDITSDNDILDCINTQSVLSGPDTIPVQWSTGVSGPQLTVGNPGWYFADMQLQNGCTLPSQQIKIDSLDTPEKPQLNIDGIIELCAGDTIIIENRSGESLEWQDGTFLQTYRITEDGDYFALAANYCDTLYSDTIHISYVNQEMSELNRSLAIDSAQNLQLTIDSESIIWYADSAATQVMGMGATLDVGWIESDTSFYFRIDHPAAAFDITGGIPSALSNTDDRIRLCFISMFGWIDVSAPNIQAAWELAN